MGDLQLNWNAKDKLVVTLCASLQLVKLSILMLRRAELLDLIHWSTVLHLQKLTLLESNWWLESKKNEQKGVTLYDWAKTLFNKQKLIIDIVDNRITLDST